MIKVRIKIGKLIPKIIFVCESSNNFNISMSTQGQMLSILKSLFPKLLYAPIPTKGNAPYLSKPEIEELTKIVFILNKKYEYISYYFDEEN